MKRLQMHPLESSSYKSQDEFSFAIEHLHKVRGYSWVPHPFALFAKGWESRNPLLQASLRFSGTHTNEGLIAILWSG